MESGREGAGLGVERQHLAVVEGRCLQVETWRFRSWEGVLWAFSALDSGASYRERSADPGKEAKP